MSLYTVVGDPHAVPGNLEKIGKLFDILEDIGNTVIILGDLFDTKEILRARVFNFVHKRLSQSKLNFVILTGNHDYFNLDCAEHSLETLKELGNVMIVDKPTIVVKMLLLPYYNDVEKFKTAINDKQFEYCKYLFGHQGIVGFDYGNGYIADGNGHGELEAGLLKRFKRVVLGHFHKFAEKGNLMFLGTPFSHSFGESDQAKYIGIFDSDSGAMELLETPFPRHRTFELDVSQRDAQASLKYLPPKDLWRVRLIGTEAQIKTIDQSIFPGVKFLEEPTDVEQVEEVALKDTDSNEQKFLTWAKEMKKLDESTIKLGLELLGDSK